MLPVRGTQQLYDDFRRPEPTQIHWSVSLVSSRAHTRVSSDARCCCIGVVGGTRKDASDEKTSDEKTSEVRATYGDSATRCRTEALRRPGLVSCLRAGLVPICNERVAQTPEVEEKPSSLAGCPGSSLAGCPGSSLAGCPGSSLAGCPGSSLAGCPGGVGAV